MKITSYILIGLIILMGLQGCSSMATTEITNDSNLALASTEESVAVITENSVETETSITPAADDNSNTSQTDMFTDRDLKQSADLAEAVYLNLTSQDNITITEEGIYVITGSAENSTIIVDTDDDKVQLVLDGVTINNDHQAAIYVDSADKVFITTTDSINTLTVGGEYINEDEVNIDAVIFSRDDLVLNGMGTLNIVSEAGNGISSKDDLKITGGTYDIYAKKDGLEANDSIRIYDGDMTITAYADALHSENEEDLTLGYIYISGGQLFIQAYDDAIRGTSYVQIDGGTIIVDTCQEGIEATYVEINGGVIDIYALDDGINATRKGEGQVVIQVNGGDITIEMAQGDTDGFDANGDIYINGGTIDVSGVSTFDADGNAILNGGTVIVNGSIVDELPTQHMGGPGQKRH